MEASEPVYASRRRRSSLAMGLACVMMALFVTCFITAAGVSDPADLLSPNYLEMSATFGILVAIMLVSGRHLILDFTKSRAIRFYDDRMEVMLPRGEARSISYSQLELGPPKTGVNFGVNFSFQLSVKGEGRRASWDVDDARTAESGEGLYEWLMKKIQPSPFK